MIRKIPSLILSIVIIALCLVIFIENNKNPKHSVKIILSSIEDKDFKTFTSKVMIDSFAESLVEQRLSMMNVTEKDSAVESFNKYLKLAVGTAIKDKNIMEVKKGIDHHFLVADHKDLLDPVEDSLEFVKSLDFKTFKIMNSTRITNEIYHVSFRLKTKSAQEYIFSTKWIFQDDNWKMTSLMNLKEIIETYSQNVAKFSKVTDFVVINSYTHEVSDNWRSNPLLLLKSSHLVQLENISKEHISEVKIVITYRSDIGELTEEYVFERPMLANKEYKIFFDSYNPLLRRSLLNNELTKVKVDYVALKSGDTIY